MSLSYIWTGAGKGRQTGMVPPDQVQSKLSSVRPLIWVANSVFVPIQPWLSYQGCWYHILYHLLKNEALLIFLAEVTVLLCKQMHKGEVIHCGLTWFKVLLLLCERVGLCPWVCDLALVLAPTNMRLCTESVQLADQQKANSENIADGWGLPSSSLGIRPSLFSTTRDLIILFQVGQFK